MKETEILNLLLEKNGLEYYQRQFSASATKLSEEISSVIKNDKEIISQIAEVMLVLRQISTGLGISRVENAYMEKINAMAETVGYQGRTILGFSAR